MTLRRQPEGSPDHFDHQIEEAQKEVEAGIRQDIAEIKERLDSEVWEAAAKATIELVKDQQPGE